MSFLLRDLIFLKVNRKDREVVAKYAKKHSPAIIRGQNLGISAGKYSTASLNDIELEI